jgi:hypothetical protein
MSHDSAVLAHAPLPDLTAQFASSPSALRRLFGNFSTHSEPKSQLMPCSCALVRLLLDVCGDAAHS